MQKYKTYSSAKMRIRLYYDYNRKISYRWMDRSEHFIGRIYAEKVPPVIKGYKKKFIKRQKDYDKGDLS